MSFKLEELQKIAEKRGREYFMDKRVDCLPATLLAVNDALKDADDVNYAEPMVLRASTPLPGGFGVLKAPCGVASAGSLAIGLKYGSDDVYDSTLMADSWGRSREWMLWVEESFGSYDCFGLTHGVDFTDPVQGQAYDQGPKRELCNTYLVEGAKKLVDMLTADNKNVTR